MSDALGSARGNGLDPDAKQAHPESGGNRAVSCADVALSVGLRTNLPGVVTGYGNVAVGLADLERVAPGIGNFARGRHSSAVPDDIQ